MALKGWLPAVVLGLGCVGMWFVPARPQLGGVTGSPVRARVVAVDDSDLQLLGHVEYGSERLEVELLSGSKKGTRFHATNELRAQLELDKKFKPGDVAVVILGESDDPATANLIARDHFRLGWALALFAGFAVLLVLFGGWTGAKALFSFVFSCFVIWKVVVPLALAGWSASWVAFAAVCLLTAVIMYLVAGWTRKGLAAFGGAMLGVFAGLALAHGFGRLMSINGATMPFVQTLLYSGAAELDMQDIFVGAMVLASSGAVMDLAMDIASGIEEVARHSPQLPSRELFLSGMRIGRSVVGTMTTTLLLAYSGGYLTLLMVFASQGTPPADFLNATLVSSEIVKTLVGSFALVLVAPFTAAVGAIVLRPGGGIQPDGQNSHNSSYVN